jgi:hypothetical protein
MAIQEPSIGRIVLVSRTPDLPPMPAIIFGVYGEGSIDVRCLGMDDGCLFGIPLVPAEDVTVGQAYWPPRV